MHNANDVGVGEHLITKKSAIKAMKKWFYETFDDDLLEEMERHNLIEQAEGFSISIMVDIAVEIEAIEPVSAYKVRAQ